MSLREQHGSTPADADAATAQEPNLSTLQQFVNRDGDTIRWPSGDGHSYAETVVRGGLTPPDTLMLIKPL